MGLPRSPGIPRSRPFRIKLTAPPLEILNFKPLLLLNVCTCSALNLIVDFLPALLEYSISTLSKASMINSMDLLAGFSSVFAGDGVGAGDSLATGDGLGLTLSAAEAEGEGLGFGATTTLGLGDGAGVGLTEGEACGVGFGDS